MTRARSFVVTEAEAGVTLSEILERMDQQPREALARGGVFVDGRRANDPAQRLRAGERVEVHAARAAVARPVEILGERAGVLAALKPADLPTEPDRTGSRSLLTELAAQLQVSTRSLHAVGRLDVGVSGIVLFARDATARQRATRARATGALHRTYLAIAAGVPEEGVSGSWQAPVGGRRAETRWLLLAASRAPTAASLLSLEPVTGRTHQLRVHAAAQGLPLFGDRRHGGPTRVTLADGSVHALDRIALHAARSELDGWVVEAPLPAELVGLLAKLGLTTS